MAYKVSNINIRARNGGFIVGVDLENANVDGNAFDNKFDEYVVPSYAKLMKALKDYKVQGLAICESHNLEEDALLLQETYRKM